MSLKGFGRVHIPFLFMVLVSGSSLGIAGLGLVGAVGNPVAALMFTALLVGLIAFWIYRSMLPSRSATGSALTLRTESFRRGERRSSRRLGLGQWIAARAQRMGGGAGCGSGSDRRRRVGRDSRASPRTGRPAAAVFTPWIVQFCLDETLVFVFVVGRWRWGSRWR